MQQQRVLLLGYAPLEEVNQAILSLVVLDKALG
jgi:hypothetical protein